MWKVCTFSLSYCYFDLRELLGHYYLEIIYLNQAGVDLMQTLITNEFDSE